MKPTWSREEMLSAVDSMILERHDPRTWHPSVIIERAELEDHRMLVLFRLRGQTKPSYGVYYSLTSLPYGPMTGEVRDTPMQWAGEIGIDLDELVDGGGWDGVERLPGPDGVVLLRWWNTESIER